MRKLLIAGLALAAAAATAHAGEPVPYPDGYRDWTHVKSMVIFAGHPLADPFAGIHHIYADAAALTGYRSGNFADGATIVFDLLEAQSGNDAIVEGARKFIGVMRRDAARYAETGGWGYEAFAGSSRDQRVVNDGGASCQACHDAAKDTGFVYSRLRP